MTFIVFVILFPYNSRNSPTNHLLRGLETPPLPVAADHSHCFPPAQRACAEPDIDWEQLLLAISAVPSRDSQTYCQSASQPPPPASASTKQPPTRTPAGSIDCQWLHWESHVCSRHVNRDNNSPTMSAGNYGMEQLIPMMNRMQDVFTQLGVSNNIDLPQIAVLKVLKSAKSAKSAKKW